MSVVAVKETKTHIEIAADRQITFGKFNKMVETTSNVCEQPSKLFQENGIIIGAAGLVEESSLLKIFCKNHKPKNADEDSVMEFLIEFLDWYKKKNNQKAQLKNQYIILYEGKIFECLGMWAREVKDFTAIGSGKFLALGAMYFGRSAEDGVDVAKEFDLYCGGKTKILKIKKESLKKCKLGEPPTRGDKDVEYSIEKGI